MTTYDILISLSVIIILSYIFDVFSSKTKLPAVVLLLLLGIGIKYTISLIGIDITEYESKITAILPMLGTLGLIFIVLEGALELEINRSKKGVLLKSFAAALIILLVSMVSIWALLYYGFQQDMNKALLNAVPLSVISSAIAIPSVASLTGYEKEFIVYESSFSDIIGVMAFNFVLTNSVINGTSFINLGYEILLILIISILATISLGFLFEKVKHHKKFMLLLAILILCYGIAKHFHLSALILIFVFGLFAGNNDFFINKLFKRQFKMHVLQKELHNFHWFIVEFAFVIRTFFFVIFGMSIDFTGLLKPQNIVVASFIILIIYLVRFVYFKITRSDKDNLLWFIAPRGLITILLFYSIPEAQKIEVLNQDVLLLVILLSIIILTFGSILSPKKTPSPNTGLTLDN